jgi:predicted transcriptional regulator
MVKLSIDQLCAIREALDLAHKALTKSTSYNEQQAIAAFVKLQHAYLDKRLTEAA